jgi:hypothetical protein
MKNKISLCAIALNLLSEEQNILKEEKACMLPSLTNGHAYKTGDELSRKKTFLCLKFFRSSNEASNGNEKNFFLLYDEILIKMKL